LIRLRGRGSKLDVLFGEGFAFRSDRFVRTGTFPDTFENGVRFWIGLISVLFVCNASWQQFAVSINQSIKWHGTIGQGDRRSLIVC
jgi:hypothetical protein